MYEYINFLLQEIFDVTDRCRLYKTGSKRHKLLILTHHTMLTAGSHIFLLHITGLLVALPLVNKLDALAHFSRKMEIKDRILFPDQLDYLRVWLSRCAREKLIYWSPNDKCYEEWTQGPCSVGRVLVFDRKKIQPRCENYFFKFQRGEIHKLNI
jgi:hypothetical protein